MTIIIESVAKSILSALNTFKPEIIKKISLNNEIELLNNHINYLKANNKNVDPFIEKFENLIFEKHFGITKAKYDFFYSHKDILIHFEHFHLKILASYTYKDINKGFIVILKPLEKFICIFFSFLGLLAIIFLIFLIPYFLISGMILSEHIIYIAFITFVLIYSIVYVFMNLFAPLFLVPRFNKKIAKS